MAVLILAVLGLPLTIKGDGTLAGQIKIILYYTLGLSTVILGVATLWASCGAISQEVESKQIQLVTVKPVSAFEIWLGKWLGLLVMNTVLLFTVGLIVWFLVYWNIRSADKNAREMGIVREELLAGRRLILPRDTLDEEVRERYHAMMNSGMITTNVARDEVLASIRKDLLAAKTVVGPGAAKRWILDMPDYLKDAGKEGKPVTLQIRFSPVRRGNNAVCGEWSMGTERKPVLFNMVTNVSMDGTYQFTVPVTPSLMDSIMEDPVTNGSSRGHTMIVEYRNGTGSESRTVVFDRKQGIVLYVRESGFEANLIRSMLVILCRLALLAALGLTAGTVFSFPVATFSAFSLILLSVIIHYFIFLLATDTGSCCAEHASAIDEESIGRKIAEQAAKGVDVVLAPVMRRDPVDLLSEGELVSWGDVGKALLLMVIVYPALFGFAGVLLLRRRELALPAT